MTDGAAVHVVLPDDVDDPTRPSGGNHYDRRLCQVLAELGWQVVEHPVAGGWPHPETADLRSLADELAGLPERALVLLDGLLGSAAPDVLAAEADRLALVALVHLPLAAMDREARDREALALGSTRRILTTSGWTRDRLVDWYALDPARITVARPGVDPAPLTTQSVGGTRLLCVAPVTRAKGADVLVEALSRTPGDWTCTVVGRLDLEPDLVDDLVHRAHDLGLTARLQYVGPLTRPALASAYAAADLLVLPSRMETYGMVVTEALARGVPVLATDVGGIREAVGQRPAGSPGALVPPGDADALGAALRTWLADASHRGRCRRAAQERRGELDSWTTTAVRVATGLELARDAEPSGVPIRRPG